MPFYYLILLPTLMSSFFFSSVLFFLWLLLFLYFKQSHSSYHSFISLIKAHSYAKLANTPHCLRPCTFSKVRIIFCWWVFGLVSRRFASSFIILSSLLACEVFQACSCFSFMFYTAPVVLMLEIIVSRVKCFSFDFQLTWSFLLSWHWLRICMILPVHLCLTSLTLLRAFKCLPVLPLYLSRMFFICSDFSWSCPLILARIFFFL